jgi:two-component system response regulator FixJ
MRSVEKQYTRSVHILAAANRVEQLKPLLHSAGLITIVHETLDALLDAAPLFLAGCVLVHVARNGSTPQAQLKALRTRLPFIAILAKGDVRAAVAAMKAGAVDCIEWPERGACLLAAIDAALVGSQQEAEDDEPGRAARRLAVLTSRERQVLDEIVAGRPNKVIAHKLAISTRTVEIHRAHMLKRLGVRGIAEVISLSALAALAAAARRVTSK